MKITIFSALTLLSLFACQPVAPKFDLEQEKAAIQKVIAEETETYYRQDFAGWKNTYADAPYFRSYCYWEGWPEKVRAYNGFDTLAQLKKAQFEQDKTIWKGSTEERSHENFRIFPEVAWYTFEQHSYEKDTRKFLGRSLETRILEKQDGQWKIVYLGYHYFPDTTAVQ
jgi:hypothetical protein